MSIWRQVKDGVIVNRIVVDDGKSLPDGFPERETYELETEDPAPQKWWTRSGPDEPFVPPPSTAEDV